MNILFPNISNTQDDGSKAMTGIRNTDKNDSYVSGTKETSSASFEKSSAQKAMAYCEHKDGAANIDSSTLVDEAQTAMDMNVVLSNTMSGADYSKACEDGFDMKDVDSAEASNILDHIKVVLAKSGTTVEGFNDDLDTQELENLTGSAAYAQDIETSLHENDVPVTQDNVESIMKAVDTAEGISEPDWSVKRYMTDNDREPTISNIYQAEYSTNGLSQDQAGYFQQGQGDYYALKSEDDNIEQLMPQIEKVIENAGLDASDEENTDRCVSMIKNGIPLTAENLTKCTELDNIQFPLDRKDVIEAGAAAIADGKSAIEGNLARPVNMVDQAIGTVEKVNSISDQAVQNLVEKNVDLNIRNLSAETERIGTLVEADNEITTADSVITTGDSGKAAPVITTADFEKADSVITTGDSGKADSVITTGDSGKTDSVISTADSGTTDSGSTQQSDSTKLDTARLRLEEVRLEMTAEANLKLLQSGYQIDTAPIEELISKLKENVNTSSEYTADVTDESYNDIVNKISMFPGLNEGYIGALKDEFSTDTLDVVIDKAVDYTAEFKKVENAYSDAMTVPRFDLGDSLSKAFGNVDSILEELGQTVTPQNRKAVRILGYNSMEITTSNIDQVSAIDSQLTKVTDKLKPATVLEMIRNGENPLSMTIDELENSLDELDNDNQSASDEKYSKFLYKLEQNADITNEERDSYIGIYRLFDTLKKTDDAAIGSVLNTGAEMTIGNLLSAVRTSTKASKGMDYKVDDDFGGVESVAGDTPSISEQIESAFKYYSDQADIVYDNLEPEKLHQTMPDDNTGLSELADGLQNAETDATAESAWQELQLKSIRENTKQAADNGAAKMLSDNGIKITASELSTASQIIASGESSSGGIWDKILKTLGKTNLSGRKKDFLSDYTQNIEDISDELTDLVDENDTGYIDMAAISMMHKQLSLSQQMAEHNTYDVPVQIGDSTVSMHITMRESEDEGSYVDASINTPEYGNLTMSMSVNSQVVSGIISCEGSSKDSATEYCDQIKRKTAENIVNEDPELKIGEFIYGDTANNTVKAGTAKTADKTLFTLAHAFITAVGNGENE